MAVDVVVVRLVGLALFFDFLLVTMVIPIVPSMFVGRAVEAGVLFSAKPALQALCNPAVARYMGNVDALRLGTLAGALGSIAFGLVPPNFALLVLIRALQGAASAGVMTGGLALLLSAHDDADQGEAASGALLGLTLGVSLGPMVGGPAYDAFGRAAPFAAVGACMLLLALVLYLVLAAAQPPAAEAEAPSLSHEGSYQAILAVAREGSPPLSEARSARAAEGGKAAGAAAEASRPRAALLAERPTCNEERPNEERPPPLPPPLEPRSAAPPLQAPILVGTPPSLDTPPALVQHPPHPHHPHHPAHTAHTDPHPYPHPHANRATRAAAVPWRALLSDHCVLTAGLGMLAVSLTVGALEPIVAYTTRREWGFRPWQQGVLWGCTVPTMHAVSTLAINRVQKHEPAAAGCGRLRLWRPEHWVRLGLALCGVGAPCLGLAPLLGGPAPLGMLVAVLGLELVGLSMGCVITMMQPLLAAIATRRGDRAVAPLMAVSNSGQSLGFVLGPLLGGAASSEPRDRAPLAPLAPTRHGPRRNHSSAAATSDLLPSAALGAWSDRPEIRTLVVLLCIGLLTALVRSRVARVHEELTSATYRRDDRRRSHPGTRASRRAKPAGAAPSPLGLSRALAAPAAGKVSGGRHELTMSAESPANGVAEEPSFGSLEVESSLEGDAARPPLTERTGHADGVEEVEEETGDRPLSLAAKVLRMLKPASKNVAYSKAQPERNVGRDDV